MSEAVPKGWALSSLSAAATAVGGGTPSKAEPKFWNGGTTPWVSPKDMKTFAISASEDAVTDAALARLTLVPENSVLAVVRSGILSRTFPVAVSKVPVTVNQDMRAFVPHEDISPSFLAWQLVAKEREILASCSKNGTTVASIEGPALSRFPIWLAPVAEQTRIVAKLEELLSDLDAGVTELKSAQKKLAQYRQSLLKAAVEGRLTADWRAQRAAACADVPGVRERSARYEVSVPAHTPSVIPAKAGIQASPAPLDARFRGHDDQEETGADLLARILRERRARWEAKQLAKFKEQGKTPPKDWQRKYPEPVAPTGALPALPDGWTWATIDQLSVEQRYGSSAKTSEDQGGVPVLRMGNIQNGQLDCAALKYLPVEHGEFPDLYLQDGDLLFNRTNSPELVGKCAVYRSQVVPCSYASYLIAVRFGEGIIPELGAAHINSAYGRAWVKSVVVQQVGQANVNGSKLAALAVPLPPFEEQKRIVRELEQQLEAASVQLNSIELSLTQSTAQRQNTLRAAFAGHLVPQDPNDEPASVLLERIQAARDKGSTGKRPARRRRQI